MNDLLLNLLAEGIGIVVTVFFIDRLLKRREQRSWRPAIMMVHQRVLTEIVDEFLRTVLPPDFLEPVIDHTPWSQIRISEEANSGEVGKPILRNLGSADARLKSTLNPPFLERQRHSDKPPNPIAYLPDTRRLEVLEEVEGLFEMPEHVSPIRQRIVEIFDHSGSLLGPELASMLRIIDGHLSDIEQEVKSTKSEFGLLAGQYKIYQYIGENPDKLDKPALGKVSAQRLEHHTQHAAAALTTTVRQMIRTKAWLEADLGKTS